MWLNWEDTDLTGKEYIHVSQWHKAGKIKRKLYIFATNVYTKCMDMFEICVLLLYTDWEKIAYSSFEYGITGNIQGENQTDYI